MTTQKFAHEISMDKITYAEPKPMGDKGGKIINIRYDDSPEFAIQLPIMTTPYGVGKYEDGEKAKYDIHLSFRDHETNPRVKAFYEFMKNFDANTLKHAKMNSLAWFKKKSTSLEVLKALYTPCVKIATENGEPTEKYAPTFKMKLPYKNNAFTCSVFNMNTKEKMEDSLENIITKGTQMVAIIKHTGVWYAGGKFGNGWQVVQLLVKPTDKLTTYAFRDEDDEDDKTVTEEEADVQEPTAEYVIDSDEEDL